MINRETPLRHKTEFATKMVSPYQVNPSVYFVSVHVKDGLAALNNWWKLFESVIGSSIKRGNHVWTVN